MLSSIGNACALEIYSAEYLYYIVGITIHCIILYYNIGVQHYIIYSAHAFPTALKSQYNIEEKHIYKIVLPS